MDGMQKKPLDKKKPLTAAGAVLLAGLAGAGEAPTTPDTAASADRDARIVQQLDESRKIISDGTDKMGAQAVKFENAKKAVDGLIDDFKKGRIDGESK